ncbi:tetratricopeptide repeat protein [Archangium violaceum]|uniref:tetratricopeptide repeat protein n=1 Tax=Archangium violaceum TaxID=83451 RepID=UPI00194DF8A2|nr:tetratricopeptide repeat protein [Archangium violaceum]QRN95244.1 tetratricopeptide repeat protein [Archangium violaceum]
MGLVVGALALACAGPRANGPVEDRIGAALAAAPADLLASRWMESARALEGAARDARASGDPRLPQVELAWGSVLVELGRKDREVRARALAILTALEEGPAGQRDPVLRGAALLHKGRVYYWRKLIQNEGEWDHCLSLFRESLALREAHGDTKGVAESLFYVGLVHQWREGFEAARPFFERSLERAREAGDALQQSFSLRHLAFADEEAGRLEQALEQHRRALSLREEVGYRWGVMFQAVAVGDVLCMRGNDCVAAEPYYARAAELSRELNEPLGAVEAHMGLGRVARARGDGSRARQHFEAAVEAARQASDAVSEGRAALALSEVLVAGGDRAEARRVLEAAWRVLTRSGQQEQGREVKDALGRLGDSER